MNKLKRRIEELKAKYPSVVIEPGPDNTEWAEAVKSQMPEYPIDIDAEPSPEYKKWLKTLKS